MRALVDYEWPGNVRELENIIERGVVLSSTTIIDSGLLPGHITGRSFQDALLEHNPNSSLFDILEDIERRIIIEKLERCNWNQTDAAEQFHIPLSTLNQKIKRLNIEIRKKGRDWKTAGVGPAQGPCAELFTSQCNHRIHTGGCAAWHISGDERDCQKQD